MNDWWFPGSTPEFRLSIVVVDKRLQNLPEGAGEQSRRLGGKLSVVLQIIIVASNIMMEMILLWRCHAVWGRRFRVVILPSLLCLTINVLGIFALSGTSPGLTGLMPPVDYGTQTRLQGQLHKRSGNHVKLPFYFAVGSFCANILLAGLTAGRIFYISHRVERLAAQRVSKLYKTIIYASLESGVPYLFNILLYASFLLRMHLKSDEEWSTIELVSNTCLKLSYTSLVMMMVSHLSHFFECPLAIYLPFPFFHPLSRIRELLRP
ncbi:hypothetical protein PM082_012494 [Marasmius tenuissimus]|nr:hypothetical protein PM082_012494 [Marasmius tenuissimus]